MDRFYRIAWELAFQSQYHGRNKRMASVVVYGGKVLSKACNMEGKHCEVRALRPHRDYSGATVYVARTNGLISRPCKRCIPVLKSAGIARMVYINIEGNLTCEFIR